MNCLCQLFILFLSFLRITLSLLAIFLKHNLKDIDEHRLLDMKMSFKNLRLTRRGFSGLLVGRV
jgi:hypothetical protein